jgi:predicted nuclease with RNAse H fold
VESLTMRLIPTRSLWGIREPLDIALPQARAEGFAAIEAPLPLLTDHQRRQLGDLARHHGLGLLPLVTTSGDSVAAHLASLRIALAEALNLGPILINVHSGRDAWNLEESVHFYREVRRIEADCPVTVCHETHRGRTFFNPWRTREVLLAVEGLRLTADFSHWVCVAERRVLDDAAEQDLLLLVADHVRHIHARVGHAQGPQVPDPRDMHYEADLIAHERWWDLIWDRMRAQGCSVCTLTPEFGPPPYQATLPFTGMPVADTAAICRWQMER